MIKLIKNGEVYNPDYIGKKDILAVNDKIVKIGDDIDLDASLKFEVLDASDKIIIPGLIDQHVHIIGGGGEAGFSSRIPGIKLSTLVAGGVTTVLGLLGTDGTTRSLYSLLAESRALEELGLTSYIVSGAYQYPSPTITGSMRDDIILIDKVIGSKIAISDHRASFVTVRELAEIASNARVAGMISKKAGIVVVHVGSGKSRLNLIYDTLENTDIPVKHFMPTHLNRNDEILSEAIKYAKIGGFIDFTAVPLRNRQHPLSAGEAVKEAIASGVPLEQITVSSDGNGSWSKYNKKGHLTKIGASNPNDLFEEIKHLIVNEGFSVSDAIKPATSNVAKALQIYPQKGALIENSDADILILDKDCNVDTVIAKGAFMRKEKKAVKKGMFE